MLGHRPPTARLGSVSALIFAFLALAQFADGQTLEWLQFNDLVSNGPRTLPMDDRRHVTTVDASGNQYVITVGSWLTKVSPTGATLWRVKDDVGCVPHALVLATDGAVRLVGECDGRPWAASISAQDGQVQWQQRDAPDHTLKAVDAAVDSVGNTYAILATQGSYAAIKYAADGTVLWSRVYDADTAAGYVNWIASVALDQVGSAYVTGYSVEPTSGMRAFLTMRLRAADGAMLWAIRDEGSVSSGSWASRLAVDSTGVYVIGSSYMSSTNSDWMTVKYAHEDGRVIWRRTYGSPAGGADWPSALALDGVGGVYVVGTTSDGSDRYAHTVKYDASDGDAIWGAGHGTLRSDYTMPFLVVDRERDVHIFDLVAVGINKKFRVIKRERNTGRVAYDVTHDAGTQATPRGFHLDAQGNLIVMGTMSTMITMDTAESALLVLKIKTDFETILTVNQVYFQDSSADSMQRDSLRVTQDGSAYFSAFASVPSTPSVYHALYFSKYSPHGTLAWQRWYSGASSRITSLADLDDTGNLYSFTETVRFSATQRVAKFAAPDGVSLWEYENTNELYFTPLSLIVGPDDDLYWVDMNESDRTSVTMHKRFGSNGAPAWTSVVDVREPASSARSIHDRRGNTYVFDRQLQPGGGQRLRKYGADGALLWTTTAEPGGYVFATDSSGDVYVASTVWSSDQRDDFYLARYSAKDGQRLWQARLRDRGLSQLVSLSVDDKHGAVYLGGTTYDPTQGPLVTRDVLVVRCSLADGSLIWRTIYDGPSHLDDFLGGLATDVAGDVYVVGTSYMGSGTASTAHARILKLAAADGSIVWNIGHADRSTTTSFGTSIATAPDGAVFIAGDAQRKSTHADVFVAKYRDGGANAHLWITTNDGVKSATRSSHLRYEIDAGNSGPADVSQATINAQFASTCAPVNWTCTSVGGATCTAAGDGNIFDHVVLPVGGRLHYVARCQVADDASGPISNQATVWSTLPDPDPDDNIATDVDDVGAWADLSVDIKDLDDPLPAGSPIRYSVTYTNRGPSVAADAMLELTLPAATQVLSADPSILCSRASAVVRCHLGQLTRGTSGTLSLITTSPPPAETYRATAHIWASSSDPGPLDDVDTERTAVAVTSSALKRRTKLSPPRLTPPVVD